MVRFLCSIPPQGWAVFFARWILGIVFLMRGWWKTFEMGPAAHAERFFTSAYETSWIPEPLLWALGVIIPVLELAQGILLLIGYQVRLVLVTIGGLLIITTYGHALQEPFFDIDGHTFTYLALILFLFLVPADGDRLSLDHWRRGRRA